MNLQRTAYLTIILFGITYFLMNASSYLIPLVLAFLVWDMVRGVRSFINKSRFVNKFLPIWIQNMISFGVIFLILGILSNLILTGITQFYAVLPQYQNNVYNLNASLLEKYDYDILEKAIAYLAVFNYASILEPVLNALTIILADSFMVILYVIFLMLEERIFREKFQSLFPNKEQYKKVAFIIHEIDELFSEYLLLKTMVSLLTGVLSYLALLIIGVDSPILWAIMIFLLNYIPSIGSLIATAFPTVVALLQFGDLTPAIWVLVIVGLIQVIVGNFVEPKIMGNSLNISPFVVIVALVLWGAIWGIVGMLLSVPITVMVIIILAQFNDTKNLALMLSESGDISKFSTNDSVEEVLE